MIIEGSLSCKIDHRIKAYNALRRQVISRLKWSQYGNASATNLVSEVSPSPINMLHPTADDKEKRRRLNRPSKRIRIHESRKFLLVVETRMEESFLVETRILGFAVRERAEGIRNPTNDWNPGTLNERRSYSDCLQEPITQSGKFPCARVTAFSRTSLFFRMVLARIWITFTNQSAKPRDLKTIFLPFNDV